MMQTQTYPFENLLALARAAKPQPEGEDWDEAADNAYWNCIEILAGRGEADSVAQVLKLTRGDAFERSFSATILGRLKLPGDAGFATMTDRLLEMLAVEEEQEVIESLLAALGQNPPEPRILAAVKGFYNHPHWSLRWQVTLHLAKYETPESVELLLILMRDPDRTVREWATFALKNQETSDSPAIREAFVERLSDEDAHVRNEALVGLALRKDARVVSALSREVDENGASPMFQEIADSPDYELIPALKAMLKDNDDSGDQQQLKEALRRCEAFLQNQ